MKRLNSQSTTTKPVKIDATDKPFREWIASLSSLQGSLSIYITVADSLALTAFAHGLVNAPPINNKDEDDDAFQDECDKFRDFLWIADVYFALCEEEANQQLNAAATAANCITSTEEDFDVLPEHYLLAFRLVRPVCEPLPVMTKKELENWTGGGSKMRIREKLPKEGDRLWFSRHSELIFGPSHIPWHGVSPLALFARAGNHPVVRQLLRHIAAEVVKCGGQDPKSITDWKPAEWYYYIAGVVDCLFYLSVRAEGFWTLSFMLNECRDDVCTVLEALWWLTEVEVERKTCGEWRGKGVSSWQSNNPRVKGRFLFDFACNFCANSTGGKSASYTYNAAPVARPLEGTAIGNAIENGCADNARLWLELADANDRLPALASITHASKYGDVDCCALALLTAATKPRDTAIGCIELLVDVGFDNWCDESVFVTSSKEAIEFPFGRNILHVAANSMSFRVMRLLVLKRYESVVGTRAANQHRSRAGPRRGGLAQAMDNMTVSSALKEKDAKGLTPVDVLAHGAMSKKKPNEAAFHSAVADFGFDVTQRSTAEWFVATVAKASVAKTLPERQFELLKRFVSRCGDSQSVIRQAMFHHSELLLGGRPYDQLLFKAFESGSFVWLAALIDVLRETLGTNLSSFMTDSVIDVSVTDKGSAEFGTHAPAAVQEEVKKATVHAAVGLVPCGFDAINTTPLLISAANARTTFILSLLRMDPPPGTQKPTNSQLPTSVADFLSEHPVTLAQVVDERATSSSSSTFFPPSSDQLHNSANPSVARVLMAQLIARGKAHELDLVIECIVAPFFEKEARLEGAKDTAKEAKSRLHAFLHRPYSYDADSAKEFSGYYSAYYGGATRDLRDETVSFATQAASQRSLECLSLLVTKYHCDPLDTAGARDGGNVPVLLAAWGIKRLRESCDECLDMCLRFGFKGPFTTPIPFQSVNGTCGWKVGESRPSNQWMQVASASDPNRVGHSLFCTACLRDNSDLIWWIIDREQRQQGNGLDALRALTKTCPKAGCAPCDMSCLSRIIRLYIARTKNFSATSTEHLTAVVRKMTHEDWKNLDFDVVFFAIQQTGKDGDILKEIIQMSGLSVLRVPHTTTLGTKQTKTASEYMNHLYDKSELERQYNIDRESLFKIVHMLEDFESAERARGGK